MSVRHLAIFVALVLPAACSPQAEGRPCTVAAEGVLIVAPNRKLLADAMLLHERGLGKKLQAHLAMGGARPLEPGTVVSVLARPGDGITELRLPGETRSAFAFDEAILCDPPGPTGS